MLKMLKCLGFQAFQQERQYKALVQGQLNVVTSCVGHVIQQDVRSDVALVLEVQSTVQHITYVLENGAVVLCGMQAVPDVLHKHVCEV